MIEKLKGLLIEDWKRAWRLVTIWLAVLIGVLDAAYEYLPVAQQYLPTGWVKYAAAVLIIARLIKQKKWRET